MNFNDSELPLYRSHKLVRAAKITDVEYDSGAVYLVLAIPGKMSKVAEVDQEWLDKRVPKTRKTPVGGYFIRLETDGYTSWVPAEVFEAGNRALTPAEIALLAQEKIDGTFPQGRANVNDDGALTLAVSLADAPTGSMVRIDFGKPTAWIGLPPQHAMQLASAILKKAREGGAVVTLEL
ncbi:MAG: hypothetical protein JWQ03_614 [Variovorax sp.]|nr:hypothetical protein [Variovorax sp.]